eukprot:sb/3477883/
MILPLCYYCSPPRFEGVVFSYSCPLRRDGSRFGGKEEYMSFMNDFVETAIPNMDLFLSKISVSYHGNHGNEVTSCQPIGNPRPTSYTRHTKITECIPFSQSLKHN